MTDIVGAHAGRHLQAVRPEALIGGIELLAGSVRVALVSPAGQIVRRAEADFPATDDAAVLQQTVQDTVTGCLEGSPLCGVGVASAGLVDHTTGVLRRIDDQPGFSGYPIAASLTRLLGCPVFVDHRARLQVLGDRWFGHGAGRASFASVATGDTLGLGLLYEGKVIAPLGGRSGAHITVALGGRRCSCGNLGCWKTIATSTWLRQESAARGLEPIDGVGDLIAAARGDTGARRLMADYADNLAVGLSSVQHLLAPGLYIVHGDAAVGGGAFLGRIEERLRAVSDWADFAERPRVVAADTAADDVALLGGAGLVLSRLSGQ
ncbi:ROK family protein [Mycobacterium sp. 21AC1]|uniref:ROK family protein n=1 Tax=[Mycobacterium] appelbergii TaxID=2939269 RepID=UPI002939385E|nr:ROK family protein [Mycobacterium sp. 21AC1]MDV3123455.1 ROK family protein [Mycobacterium sp. 21AC1]